MQSSITEIIRDRNMIIVKVLLENGAVKAKKEYRVTSEFDLKQKINADMKAIASFETEFPKLAVGEYDSSIPSQPIPQEELDQMAYKQDIAKLNSYLRAISMGVIPFDSPEYLAHVDKLKSGLKPEYVNLF